MHELRKIKTIISEKRLISTAQAHIAQKFAGKDWVVTYNMRALPDGIEISDKGDFVRVASLELTASEINRRHIEGNTAELGVFRGNFAKEINRVFSNRDLYLFDTFEGFDNRDAKTDKTKKFSTGDQDFSDTSIERVLSLMPNRDRCIVRKGWFPQTTEGLEEEIFVFVKDRRQSE